jgi:hypothetical protein
MILFNACVEELMHAWLPAQRVSEHLLQTFHSKDPDKVVCLRMCRSSTFPTP